MNRTSHLGAHTENITAVGCGHFVIYIQRFIVSVHRVGARNPTMGNGSRPLTLIHLRNFKEDTA